MLPHVNASMSKYVINILEVSLMKTNVKSKKAARIALAIDSETIAAPPDVVMSLRVEAAMHERLRKLAFDKRMPMRDFIVRGIEQVLKEEKY
jgi:hypothetical protein